MLEKIKSFLSEAKLHIQDTVKVLSFQAKLILSIVLGISVFVTISAFFIVNNIQSNIDAQIFRLNNNLKSTQILAYSGAQIITTSNSSGERDARLQKALKKYIKENPETSYVLFTDNSGRIIARSKYCCLFGYKKEQRFVTPPKHVPFIKISYSKNGKVLNIAEPIQFNSNLFGWVWVGMPDHGFTIVGSKKQLWIFLLEIFLLVWILSIIGAIVNSQIVIQPIKKLERGAKAIAEGRFGFQLPLKGLLGRELTQLVKAFNRMSKRLQQYEESNLAILDSERNKFESVVMSIADGVLVVDKEDRIQIINHAAGKLLDRSGDEIIGKKISEIWDKDINKFVSEYLSKIKQEENRMKLDYASYDELIRDNKNLKLIITPLLDSNEKHLGAVMVIQDRTKEVEVEAIKQEFISNVSHELRTPITSIKCYVDTLCSHTEGLDRKTQQEFLSTINEETDRLSSLVNDVLELSKLESHSTKLNLELQEIYPSTDFAMKSIEVLANKKSISLVQEIDSNLPMIRANQENLERILINLLSNAVKYTPGNGLVKLSVKRSDDKILFQIIDNGIGIAEEDIPLLFDRFYRVENKVHTIKGTGLGLTIVKKSVEQHSGEINVRSRLGEGTMFEFSIPIPSDIAFGLEHDKIQAA